MDWLHSRSTDAHRNGIAVLIVQADVNLIGALAHDALHAPQGVAALWGMQRVMRQRANQVHISFYDQYSNSAFDARP